jgi:hypothetical protein
MSLSRPGSLKFVLVQEVRITHQLFDSPNLAKSHGIPLCTIGQCNGSCAQARRVTVRMTGKNSYQKSQLVQMSSYFAGYSTVAHLSPTRFRLLSSFLVKLDMRILTHKLFLNREVISFF